MLSPLERYVFVAVYERIEDVMYSEVRRRNNGKEEGVAAEMCSSVTSF